MSDVVYYGEDQRFVEIVSKFFEARKKEAQEMHTLTVITDEKKWNEFLGTGVPIHLIFVSQNKTVPLPDPWLASLKKKFPMLEKIPIVLMGDERVPGKVMKSLEAGYTDYFVLPPDKALFVEKFSLFTTGKRNADVKQVYSLSMAQPTDLAKPGIIEELSEFDCKVKVSHKITVGDILIFYAKAFSEAETMTSILGRCYKCDPHKAAEGQFLACFYFVGIRPEILTNIRNSLLKSYVASKTKN
jgi:hypothetical protein